MVQDDPLINEREDMLLRDRKRARYTETEDEMDDTPPKRLRSVVVPSMEPIPV
ncbi:hypothetical protein LINGRAHAP2_LOCUS34566, partial [Linum grandiflorum]